MAFRNALGAQLLCPRSPLTLLGPKLGVAIGLDETVVSARISCYETGQHEPPYQTAQQLATVMNIPVAYLYCDGFYPDFTTSVSIVNKTRDNNLLSLAYTAAHPHFNLLAQ